MRIVNLKKFIRGMMLLFFLILVIILFTNHSSLSYNEKSYIHIYVSEGDTLWSIATNIQDTDYYKGKDIRYIINDIKKTNNLKNSNISIGEKIFIPTI